MALHRRCISYPMRDAVSRRGFCFFFSFFIFLFFSMAIQNLIVYLSIGRPSCFLRLQGEWSCVAGRLTVPHFMQILSNCSQKFFRKFFFLWYDCEFRGINAVRKIFEVNNTVPRPDVRFITEKF